MKYNLFYIPRFFFYLLTIYLTACAQVVAPEGGPKDYDPPVVVRSVPANYSTGYNGQDVRIYFNEYVKLKNLNQNLLVSPPLKNDPEIRVKGRSIIMSISDTLLDNTTYNFFFGESVVDITEENPIPNFQYVVSTGSTVDSLSVRGELVDAYTLKPEGGAFVMMYENVNVGDSAPLLRRPVYLTKTGSDGRFEINNLREGEYLLFALKDLNSNFYYDNPDEIIGFVDTLVKPFYFSFNYAGILEQVKAEKDSAGSRIPEGNARVVQAIRDSVLASDSLVADSIFNYLSSSLPYHHIRSFKERDTVQRVVSAQLAERGKVNIITRIPADSLVIRDYINNFPDNWYLSEFNRHRDTLTLWLPNVATDSLFLEISDRGQIIDSVKVSTKPRAERSRTTSRNTAPEEPKANLVAPTLASRGVHPYYLPFELKSRTPLNSFNNSRFSLLLNDSIPVEVNFEFNDTLQRVLQMDYRPMADSSYVLYVLPGAVSDIFGAQNDSIEMSFRVNSEASYGAVLLELSFTPAEKTQYLLQMVDENLTDVAEQKIINSSGTYRFDHLPATKFMFRLIEDTNGNGLWDSGKYINLIQPETVYIFPDIVQSRLKWEVEVQWRMEEK